jgi:putative transcriptional regulator
VKTDEILREVRSQTMLSQARFANKFCIPVRTYEQWERGLRVPPDYVVKLIVRLLEYEGYLDYTDYIHS